MSHKHRPQQHSPKTDPPAATHGNRTAGPGRPAGSPNVTAAAEMTPSRCTNESCRSTRRTKYASRNVLEHAGETADGQPYTHIVRRRTRCADCGQVRIDRSLEHWPDGDPGESADAEAGLPPFLD